MHPHLPYPAQLTFAEPTARLRGITHLVLGHAYDRVRLAVLDHLDRHAGRGVMEDGLLSRADAERSDIELGARALAPRHRLGVVHWIEPPPFGIDASSR